ncbi:PucR family transcriptional regulator [Actinomadura flavalba]|uniref:PucR family transcriptional regulator n=1 Tax=Actinomadura flavalba TaxID=1120938 RepID=UPI0003685CA6|nr:helix-turn-helix domain-containing protein [Actinomadura flavalba]
MAESRLMRWFTDNVPHLAQLVTEESRRALPYYAAMPQQRLFTTMLPAAEASIGFSAQKLREGNPTLTAEERRAIIDWSARRAEQGVPLDVALAAHHLGNRVCWEAIAAEARPDEADDLAAITRHMFDFLQEVIPAVATAHVRAQEERRGEQREGLRMLHGALLAGEPAEALAGRVGVELAEAYRAVTLRFAGEEPTVARTVRTVREVQQALGTTLASVQPHAVSVLLPKTAPGNGDALTRLVTDVERAAGRPVVAAVAEAVDRARIPAAAQEAAEVSALVLRLGRPPGTYTLDDVLLEYQLARPGEGLARMAARLDPLADHPELLDTLRIYVQHGHNRRLTARDLHIHRNTLDYRLRGVARRTGLDPGEPQDAQILAAALTARDLLD